jgi:hypothetical protein
MKTMILFRFGVMPNPSVSEILANHMADKGYVMKVPGAVVSIFHTNSELSQIDQELKMLSTKEGPSTVPLTYMLTEITDLPYSIALQDQLINDYVGQYTSYNSYSQNSTTDLQKKIQQLQKKLEQAIATEEFEEAAAIRDLILTANNQL